MAARARVDAATEVRSSSASDIEDVAATTDGFAPFRVPVTTCVHSP